ncbi:MAG TPA: antitoxin family protein [Chloroflexota bacterium]|nr:antitoxin family protein [Chloroflexota bacterium]
MAQTVRATFDGEVLRPERPVDLQPNTTYVITIEREAPIAESAADEVYPLTVIGRLATDMGVIDLSVHHDRYAHGCLADESGGA